MKKCYEIIRNLREDKDLKQSDVAKILGTTQQQYSKYENGKSDIPVWVLGLLAGYYNISADYLIGRTDCAEDLSGLDTAITENYTAGKLISDVLSLGAGERHSLVEYVELLKLRDKDNKKIIN